MYHFKPGGGDKASLIETAESREGRKEMKTPLDATERMELEGTAKTSSST